MILVESIYHQPTSRSGSHRTLASCKQQVGPVPTGRWPVASSTIPNSQHASKKARLEKSKRANFLIKCDASFDQKLNRKPAIISLLTYSEFSKTLGMVPAIGGPPTRLSFGSSISKKRYSRNISIFGRARNERPAIHW